MYYFGYGSNMLLSRLRRRVPSAEPAMNAKLPEHTLRFHKRSRDGSGKCNIVSAPSETVHGVVFEVSPADLDALDEAEQQGRRYRRQSVTVQGTTEAVEAFAYVADPFYVDDALHPYEWYHALVLAGARQHGLPDSHIAAIKAVSTIPDPSRERRRSHRILLEEAGYPLSKSQLDA
ncbi:MAG: gamma-glutamylcyclotransferase [Bacteroidetes bacterium SW_9_63_38]|nr:MAG: gamma-glutamylcyclotransferase [Bacteroidetes bacterium SW_9_63_38]